MNEQPSAAKDREIVKRVLVVDDYQEIRQLITMMLEPEGYQVATMADGVAALEFLTRAKEVWIVLLDVMMPRLSGLEVCARLRAAGPTGTRHRIALMTAAGLELQECPAPTRMLLRKPFRLAAVRDLVAMLERDQAKWGSGLSTPTDQSHASDAPATT